MLLSGHCEDTGDHEPIVNKFLSYTLKSIQQSPRMASIRRFTHRQEEWIAPLTELSADQNRRIQMGNREPAVVSMQKISRSAFARENLIHGPRDPGFGATLIWGKRLKLEISRRFRQRSSLVEQRHGSREWRETPRFPPPEHTSSIDSGPITPGDHADVRYTAGTELLKAI